MVLYKHRTSKDTAFELLDEETGLVMFWNIAPIRLGEDPIPLGASNVTLKPINEYEVMEI